MKLKNMIFWVIWGVCLCYFMGQRRNSVAELSEDDRQTVHEEWQI